MSKPLPMRKVGHMKPKMSLSRGRRGRQRKLPITPTQERETWALKLSGGGWLGQSRHGHKGVQELGLT